MHLLIQPNGVVRCLYGEALDLQQLGQLSIQRGSYVEPTPTGDWLADMSPVQGPMLGPFTSRTAALTAEQNWLLENWLCPIE